MQKRKKQYARTSVRLAGAESSTIHQSPAGFSANSLASRISASTLICRHATGMDLRVDRARGCRGGAGAEVAWSGSGAGDGANCAARRLAPI